MKAHAQRQSQPRHGTSLQLARPARRAAEHHAAPSTDANAEATQAAHDQPAPIVFAHDFSRIPVHTRAPVRPQAKLAMGSPGDAYEREADRVAERVTGTAEPRPQSACACGGGCNACKGEGKEDERLRAKRDTRAGVGVAEAPHVVGEVLRSSGRPLDAPVREFMESRFGHDFSRVRVHTGERAADSAWAVNALAYTVGSDVVFGHGRYAPHTSEGRHLLAHELTHTIQQGGGTDMAGGQPVAVSMHSGPRVSGLWPFDDEEETVAFKSVEAEVKYRLDKNDAAEDQKAYSALNGQNVTAMLATLEKLKTDGLVGTLIGRFDHATGVNRPRLWVAFSCVQYKGWGGAEESLKTELAQMRAAGEGAQADEMLAHRNPNTAQGTLASVTPSAAQTLGTAATQAAVAGAAQSADPTAAPAAAAPSAGEPEKMKLESYKLSDNKVEIVKESDKDKTLKVEESPAVYVKNVLDSVGINYDDFYKSFTTPTFFDHTVSPAIHKDFAAVLKKIESDNLNGKTPKEAGAALGVKSVGGSRDYPTSAAFSMHLVGMAVDINYTDSPFIGASASDVFGRAGLLIDGTAYSYDEKKRTYDQFSSMQKALVAYFALPDDDKKLEEKLKAAVKTEWTVSNKQLALAKTWDGMAVDLAKKQIQADLTHLAGRWQRKEDQVKQYGFLGVSKELVEAMTKGNATDWGGGGYGDIMHFDMRTQGKGATINSAFAKYKEKKKTEAQDKYTAEGEEARTTRRAEEKKAAEEKAKAAREAREAKKKKK